MKHLPKYTPRTYWMNVGNASLLLRFFKPRTYLSGNSALHTMRDFSPQISEVITGLRYHPEEVVTLLKLHLGDKEMKIERMSEQELKFRLRYKGPEYFAAWFVLASYHSNLGVVTFDVNRPSKIDVTDKTMRPPFDYENMDKWLKFISNFNMGLDPFDVVAGPGDFVYYDFARTIIEQDYKQLRWYYPPADIDWDKVIKQIQSFHETGAKIAILVNERTPEPLLSALPTKGFKRKTLELYVHQFISKSRAIKGTQPYVLHYNYRT